MTTPNDWKKLKLPPGTYLNLVEVPEDVHTRKDYDPSESLARSKASAEADLARVGEPSSEYALGAFVSTQVEPNADAPLTGLSTKRHHKCGVCDTVWDRGRNYLGLDIGTAALDYVPMKPCRCGRHPGRNTPASCAGCAGTITKVTSIRGGFSVHLCAACDDARTKFVAKRVEFAAGGGFVPTQTQSSVEFDVKLRKVESHETREFLLKTLAQSLFVSDPRVQAIVNGVTETAPPRHTKKAREARARAEAPPMLVVTSKNPEHFEERAYLLPSLPSIAKIEIIPPTNTPRQRRMRAFEIAWGRERALRHEAIRRAIVIFRGTR